MMDLARRAYEELYGRVPDKRLVVKYHGNLKEYNATVTARGNTMTFRLSRKLETCEPEVQIGVMQHLLNRINKTKVESDDIDLYHSFVRRMSDLAPVTESDPALEESFVRVNDEYFDGMMTRPNLVWGNDNTSLLGTYTYASDTITISSALQGAPEEVLDWVMYHEMLHKKHKFSCKSGRTHSHTPAFRKDEQKFKVRDAERLLERWIAGTRRKNPPAKKSSFLARVMGRG